MWNIPPQDVLDKVPRLYETEDVQLKDKVIHLHFFIAACDWYIAEFDGQDLLFGYAILNSDYQNAEWGYISFNELKSVKLDGWLEVDCDLHFQPQKASEIKKITNL